MFIIGIALGGLFTMLLWNALIPDLFHGPTLNYLQSAGLLILARIMVGRGGRGHHWRKWRSRHKGHHGPGFWGRNQTNYSGPEGSWSGPWWAAPWFQDKKRDHWEKCAKMSPEERKQAKEQWKAEFTKSWGKSEENPGKEGS